MTRGLVLAGGGVAGIAWELGVLLGIREVAPHARLIDADLIVGTSAGSSVAVQITSGTDLTDLYDAQLREETSEIDVDVDMDELTARFAQAATDSTSIEATRRLIGQLAIETATVSEADRRDVVAAELPSDVWPDRRLLIPAVDVETGELMVFTKDSGVDLLDAVTASNALPGVWPTATVNGRSYMDGSTRSSTNADLATGCTRVLVITPTRAGDPTPWGDLGGEVVLLEHADVRVIYADDASVAAFGKNPLSPATRRPAAAAGRAIGRAHAEEIARFWH